MARLVLSLDGQVMAEYNMTRERYTIGRLQDNDVRIDNPALSLPATQIRVGFLNSVEENGFALGFRLGPVDYNEFTVPTTKPGAFTFN